ncbi:STAS domain-containing protein [Mucilaginibacter robiniae]|uniref:STAS domain-containing protein n=1 Tax=Mucilaginibacter robiniae TaxID=2728022 RepID=A0A7L5E293_9SPHI|nr:STAS domain-containing protein [Mucilaginibacter robiniae]QJD96537.1 STAS domain-containing protein [Mucilaginibacter robiniae]
MSFNVRVVTTDNVQASVHLTGKLLVNHAASLQGQLASVLNRFAGGTIHLTDVSRIDIASLQVLVAFKKSAESSSKPFRFSFDFSPYLQNIIALSGFDQLFKVK